VQLVMLRTARGSPDGAQVLTYEADREYEVPDSLARVFLAEGWARRADEEAAVAEPPAVEPPVAEPDEAVKPKRRRG
jgi:hypothetical protein